MPLTAPPASPAPTSAPPAAALPTAATWACEARVLLPDGAPGELLAAPLTVGEKFFLTCAGPEAPLDRQGLSLQVPTESDRALRLLELRSLEGGHAAFVATTYKVGEFRLQNVALVDGKSRVRLDGIAFKSQSSIDAKENPEMKPYGPFAPMNLLYPPWVWLALAGILAACLAAAILAFARRAARRRFLRALEASAVVGSPYGHFNREMRQLGRRFPFTEGQPWPPDAAQEYVRELERSFRWFVARELLIPALDGGVKKPLRELRRRDRALARAHGPAIARGLRELRRAAGSKLTSTDGQQLGALCRKTVDAIERSLRARGLKEGLAGASADLAGRGWRGALSRAGRGGRR